MAGLPAGRTALLITTVLVLAACQPGKNPFGAKGAAGDEPAKVAASDATSVTLVDRDVEAPEVFQVTDLALWDGRPSLGGVWVASADAKDPERVIMRNPANGKFVIGALFQRESFNPGPKLQISSDAAEALGILAGEPVKISVTALRREEAKAEADASRPLLDANEGVTATTLGDAPTGTIDTAAAGAGTKPAARPADLATSAPGPKAPVVTSAPVATATAAADPATSPAPDPAATGAQARVQIGIFSIEANAKTAVEKLTKAGVTATSRKETTQGKTWWSVVASAPGARDALLAKVKGLGFPDAYAIR